MNKPDAMAAALELDLEVLKEIRATVAAELEALPSVRQRFLRTVDKTSTAGRDVYHGYLMGNYDALTEAISRLEGTRDGGCPVCHDKPCPGCANGIELCTCGHCWPCHPTDKTGGIFREPCAHCDCTEMFAPWQDKV